MVNANLVLSQAQLALIAHALRNVNTIEIPAHVSNLYEQYKEQNLISGNITQVMRQDRDFLIEQLGLLAVTAPEGTHAMVL